MIRFAIGALAPEGHHHITIGPRHPSQAGLVTGTARSQNGRWHDVDFQPGYCHRGAEKLFEVRDYRAAALLADRHDWLSPFTGELSVVLTIEAAMGFTSGQRVTWIRTLLAEISRIHSHIHFLSVLKPLELSENLWVLVDRIRDLLLAWSGNRIHVMLNRVGGLAADIPPGWSFPTDDVRRLADELSALLEGTQRFSGLAVLTGADCLAYGLSGPVARAAGLDLDLRPGYLAYPDVYTPAPLRTSGDGAARLGVLIDELRTSSDMIDTILRALPDLPGQLQAKLARRLKVPEGEHWSELDAPWGRAGAWLVSRGGSTPWRLALRTPSFANLAALGHALEGVSENAVADAVATIGYSVGDSDK